MNNTDVGQTTDDDQRHLSHIINNHINTIMLGLSVLEESDNPDVRLTVDILKQEVRDLHHLLGELDSDHA